MFIFLIDVYKKILLITDIPEGFQMSIYFTYDFAILLYDYTNIA